MAKSKRVSALSATAAVRKQNEKKEEAFRENIQQAEPVEQEDAIMPEPTPAPVVATEMPKPRQTTRKKQISELFNPDQQVGNKETVCIKIDKNTLKEIDSICKSLKIKRTLFINKAIDVMLESYEH